MMNRNWIYLIFFLIVGACNNPRKQICDQIDSFQIKKTLTGNNGKVEFDDYLTEGRISNDTLILYKKNVGWGGDELRLPINGGKEASIRIFSDVIDTIFSVGIQEFFICNKADNNVKGQFLIKEVFDEGDEFVIEGNFHFPR